MNIKRLLTEEAILITNFFKQNNIFARVTLKGSVHKAPAAGFVRYALKLRSDQSFSAIERVSRELSVAISQGRALYGLEAVTAMPVTAPLFAIEVEHPAKEIMPWSMRKMTNQPAHAMLLGCSFNGEKIKDEVISLADSSSCHVLVVGITGAGKSVLMQSMALSLTANTSPDDLKIVMVDLKNQDMVPFRNLPHVLTFAGTKAQAVDAINYVVAEKEKRIEQEGYKPFRLVLWIDELAELAGVKGMADALGSLASIGRGKLINIIGATQHPTNDGGLGSLLKANFPVRLAGMVAPGQSYIATGRKELYADLLPGKGAFLRLQGKTVQRFQSYMIEENAVPGLAKFVREDWEKRGYKAIRQPDMGGYDAGAAGYEVTSVSGASGYRAGASGYTAVRQPDIAGYATGYGTSHTSATAAEAITGYSLEIFPIRSGRALTPIEAQVVRELAATSQFDHAGKLSLNKLTLHVYGSKDPTRTNWIKEALAMTEVNA